MLINSFSKAGGRLLPGTDNDISPMATQSQRTFLIVGVVNILRETVLA